MPDELKKFLSNELEELRKNKIRAGALVACVVFLLIYCIMDDSRDEEISLNEPPITDAPPVTKDLPAKPLPVTKNSDGVTLVMGATADALIVADPFAGEDKPTPAPPAKSSAPVAPAAPTGIKPPPTSKPQEIILTGTAISGERKTAMFLRGKETIFLSIGEQIDGRQIVDITPDFVTFADSSRIYVQN